MYQSVCYFGMQVNVRAVYTIIVIIYVYHFTKCMVKHETQLTNGGGIAYNLNKLRGFFHQDN